MAVPWESPISILHTMDVQYDGAHQNKGRARLGGRATKHRTVTLPRKQNGKRQEVDQGFAGSAAPVGLPGLRNEARN